MKKKKKKKLPPPSRKVKKKRKINTSEVIAVFTILVAVFILISLISYDSNDPSWANATPSNQRIHNYAGRVGASLAEALLQFLGFSAFLFPLGLIYISFGAFFPDYRLFLKTVTCFLFIILSAGLLYMLFEKFSWRGTEIQAGGIIGSLVSSLLVRYFNTIGTTLLLIGLLALLILLSTRISIGNILNFFSRLFSFFFKEIRIKIVRYQKIKQREKMRKRVVEKYSESISVDKEKKKKDKKKREGHSTENRDQAKTCFRSTQEASHPPETAFSRVGEKGRLPVSSL